MKPITPQLVWSDFTQYLKPDRFGVVTQAAIDELRLSPWPESTYVPLSSPKVTKAALTLIAAGATVGDLESLKVLAVDGINSVME